MSVRAPLLCLSLPSVFLFLEHAASSSFFFLFSAYFVNKYFPSHPLYFFFWTSRSSTLRSGPILPAPSPFTWAFIQPLPLLHPLFFFLFFLFFFFSIIIFSEENTARRQTCRIFSLFFPLPPGNFLFVHWVSRPASSGRLAAENGNRLMPKRRLSRHYRVTRTRSACSRHAILGQAFGNRSVVFRGRRSARKRTPNCAQRRTEADVGRGQESGDDFSVASVTAALALGSR